MFKKLTAVLTLLFCFSVVFFSSPKVFAEGNTATVYDDSFNTENIITAVFGYEGEFQHFARFDNVTVVGQQSYVDNLGVFRAPFRRIVTARNGRQFVVAFFSTRCQTKRS